MNKSIFIILLIYISTTTLSARLNPFAPSKGYMEEKYEIIEKYEDPDGMMQEVPKEKEEEMTQEVQSRPSMSDADIIDTIKKSSSSAKSTSVSSAPFIQLNNGLSKLTNFLSVELKDNILILILKDNMRKKFTLLDDNGDKKIVFDVMSSNGFKTLNYNIENINFKSMKIGSHPQEQYYRIVVQVSQDPETYDISYKENNTIVIASPNL